jgi:hypothetical protein
VNDSWQLRLSWSNMGSCKAGKVNDNQHQVKSGLEISMVHVTPHEQTYMQRSCRLDTEHMTVCVLHILVARKLLLVGAPPWKLQLPTLGHQPHANLLRPMHT